MEIREEIIYEYSPNKLATVKKSLYNPNQFYGVFHDGSISLEYLQSSWVKDFKSGSLKLISYPYKIGDWVYDIENIYFKTHNTPQVCQITQINDDRIFVNDERHGLNFNDFNKEYRPCFKNEISKTKIVKEDMKYLIKFMQNMEII